MGITTYDVTYRSRKKDGTIRWQRAAGYVMRRANGSPITCYGLVTDVDEQKKAADKKMNLNLQPEIKKGKSSGQLKNYPDNCST